MNYQCQHCFVCVSELSSRMMNEAGPTEDGDLDHLGACGGVPGMQCAGNGENVNVAGGKSPDDDDVVLYSVVTPCCYSMLSALSRVVSFEACCQRALLSVQITRHYPTI